MLDQEAEAQHVVGEAVVDRDLELLKPDARDREQIGPLFVPMLRVGIIQVRVVGGMYLIGAHRPS